MKITRIVYFLFALLLLVSCKNDAPKNGTTNTNTAKGKFCENLPELSRDSAFGYIEKQLSFGPRTPGSEAHAECADWMVSKFKEYGVPVKVQSFEATVYTGQTYTGKNIIASVNPEQRKRLLFCAHWDSRPFSDYDPDPSRRELAVPAANDGASGVAVLMEIARVFANADIPIGVDIILFDLEDHGNANPKAKNTQTTWCLGSQHWSKNRHEPAYHAEFGILLDMVGAKGAHFSKELYSKEKAGIYVDKVWDLAHLLGYNDLFFNEDGRHITDDHLFVNQTGIQTLDIIHQDPDTETGFFEHWHTSTDNIDNIDKRTLGAVGNVLLNVLCLEASDDF